ncbi:hypothetical protein E2320_000932, partial [Naja naja]
MVWEEEGKPRFPSQDYLAEGLNNFTGKKHGVREMILIHLKFLLLLIWKAIKGELVWPKTFPELRKDGKRLSEGPEGVAFLPTDAKERMTSHPQILSFVSLLETHKPYLVNCLRLPALQAQYSLRRMTPLEQQHLYVGPQMVPEEAEGLPSFFQGVQQVPHEVKGGYRIGEFLTFNCLAVSAGRDGVKEELLGLR